MENLNFFFDDIFVFRGVLFSTGWIYSEVSKKLKLSILLPDGNEIIVPEEQYNLPSPDVAKRYWKVADNCRFNIVLCLPKKKIHSDYCKNINICIRCKGKKLVIKSPSQYKLAFDPVRSCQKKFLDLLRTAEKASVLEIGSRARSGKTYNSIFPSHFEYIGLDIIEGPNTDIVGDAHNLSKIFPSKKFDFVFSNSTFEHLLMPWVVVVEMNKVMKTGGYLMVNAPQTWPTHDEPWDYFRFSAHSWQSLFNKYTGFEIIECAQGLPAYVVPSLYLDDQVLDNQLGWLLSSVIAKKIGNTSVEWNIQREDVVETMYRDQ